MKKLFNNKKAVLIFFIALFCLYQTIALASVNLQIQADPKLNSKQIAEKKSLLLAIDQMILPTLKVPQNLLLRLQYQGEDAYHESFMPKGHRITVPYQFKLFNNIKHPNYSNPILVHEYGHCVLAENLGLNDQFRNKVVNKTRFIDFYKWEALNAQLEEVKLELDQIKQILEEKKKSGASDSDTEVVKLIQKGNELAKLLQNLEAQMEPYSEGYANLFTTLGKYHEFYADVMAITFFNYNPTVVWKAVYTTKIRNSNQQTNMEKKILKNLELRRFDKKFSWDDVSFGDSHIELSPTRYYIYKYYLSNPLYNQNKALVMRVVFEAIKDEMMMLTSSDISQLTLRQINESFMKRLDQYFAKIKK